MTNHPKHKISWLTAWIVFEVIALFLAFLSAGGGHGDYLFCKLLFPIPMYIGIVQGKIGIVSLILSLIQYPLVGIAPLLLSFRHAKYFCILFAVAHIVFAVMAVTHPSTQFR